MPDLSATSGEAWDVTRALRVGPAVAPSVIAAPTNIVPSCVAGAADNSLPNLPTAGAADLAGQRLGNYELLERIGAGGMGVVYRARHAWLGRTVAIKFVDRHLVDNPSARSRFAREAQALGELDHPNIVRATDAGELAGAHFLVTEYVEGPDLTKLIAQRGALPVADACEIIRQAALGVQHVHDHGLVHRDIKPSNLILATSGTVKLLDFGLARLLVGQTTQTSSGEVLGTLDYLAPEQAADPRRVDGRADMYSLGCAFYFLLSGQAPFDGPRYSTAVSKIHAHLADEPPDLAKLRGTLPVSVCSILEKLLAKSPEDRWPSAAALASALAPHALDANLPALLDPSLGSPAARSDWSRWLLARVRHAIWALLGGRSRQRALTQGELPRRTTRSFSFLGVALLTCVVSLLASHVSCVPIGPPGPNGTPEALVVVEREPAESQIWQWRRALPLVAPVARLVVRQPAASY